MGSVLTRGKDGVPIMWSEHDRRWFKSSVHSLDNEDRQAIIESYHIKDWYFSAERVDHTSPADLAKFAEEGIDLNLLTNEELIKLYRRISGNHALALVFDSDTAFQDKWQSLLEKIEPIITKRMKASLTEIFS